MIGLTSLDVHNSIFNTTEENNKFELYKFFASKGVVFHIKKSELRLKRVWKFQTLQLPIYKINY